MTTKKETRGRPKKPPEPVQDFYRCEGCGRDLPWGDYYIRPSGRRYNVCKKCKNTRASARCRREGLTPGLTKGVSYKQALPKERWPKATRFMGLLVEYADRATELGIEPDVWAFVQTYREVMQSEPNQIQCAGQEEGQAAN